jgi:hypothetical protein
MNLKAFKCLKPLYFYIHLQKLIIIFIKIPIYQNIHKTNLLNLTVLIYGKIPYS